MRSGFNVTLFLVLFLFTSSIIYATSELVVPQDITRFIYRYYNILTPKNLINCIKNEIHLYYTKFNTSILDEYLEQNIDITPSNLIKFIERNVSDCNNIKDYPDCSSIKIEDMSKKDWLEYVSKFKLFLIFTSESSRKAESSFGHMSFLYKSNENPLFSQVITYLASNFINESSGKPTISKYLKGALSSLEGSFYNYPFFDTVYQSMIIENRIIIQYKININKNERRKIDEKIWNISRKNTSYNFFTKNCSTEIFNLIPGKDLLNINPKYKTPADLIRVLSKDNIIKYDGAYLIGRVGNKERKIIFENNKKYNIPTKSFNQSYSFFLTKDDFLIGLSLFHFSRPYNGIINQKSNVTLLDISFTSEGGIPKLYSFTPFSINYSPLIFDYFGLKFNLATTWETIWYIKMNTGLFFKIGEFKIDLFYTSTTDKFDSDWYFDLLYSNSILDFLITQKIKLNESISPRFIMNLFISNNKSIYLDTDLIDFSIGFKIYK